MAGGYKAQPRNGFEDIRARQVATARALAATRTAAALRRTRISGGTGLTVGEDGSPQVQITVDPNPLVGGTLYFNDAADPDVAGGINGSSNKVAIFAPFEKGTVAIGTAEIDLISGPGVAANIQMSANGAGITLYGPGSIQPLAQTTVQDFDFFHNATGAFMRSASGGLMFPDSVAEVRVRAWDDSGYEPIRASAFTVSSSRRVKHRITDFGWSPLAVVVAAKAKRWHYRADHADPDRVHFGPMAEDLPDDLVDNTDETPAIDLAAMVGVLWGAVQELAAEVAQLRKEATA